MSDVIKNPNITTDFDIEIDGITVTSFERIRPAARSKTTIQNRTGTDRDHFTVTAGMRQPEEFELAKVARTEDFRAINLFNEWHDKGGQEKKSGTITYRHHETGEVYYKFSFENAICTKVQAPEGDANSENKAEFVVTIVTPRTYPVSL